LKRCGESADGKIYKLGDGLKRLGNLQKLTLYFTGCEVFENIEMEKLGKDLKTLPELQTIHLNFHKFVFCNENCLI